MAGTIEPEQPGLFLPVATVASLFALAFCVVNSWWIASAVAGAAVLGTLGLLLASRNRHGGFCPTPASLGGPYGNGPYRDIPAEPNEKIVGSLAELATKLRELPSGQGPKIDWRPIDQLTAAGKTAAEASDFCTAVRHYAAALRAVMHQIRQHRQTATHDPGSDRG